MSSSRQLPSEVYKPIPVRVEGGRGWVAQLEREHNGKPLGPVGHGNTPEEALVAFDLAFKDLDGCAYFSVDAPKRPRKKPVKKRAKHERVRPVGSVGLRAEDY